MILLRLDKSRIELLLYKSGYSFLLLKEKNNKIIFANAAPQRFLAGLKIIYY
jgi:hypothetical protein